MDKVKRARVTVRSQMTRTVNGLEAELTATDPDLMLIKQKILKLQDLVVKVNEMNQTVGDWILEHDDTDDRYEEEQTECEEYTDRAQLVILKAEDVLSLASRNQGSIHSLTSNTTGEKKRNFRLPKIELKKFGGDPLEWLGWWAQFSKIHEDESLHETDKFQYLSQAMVSGTRASKLVEGYPQSAANYPKVIAALEDRFGDKVILSEVYVRQLLKMVLANRNNGGSVTLTSLYDELESNLRALETLGVTATDSAIFLYPLVESSLPVELVKVWQRSPFSGYDGAVQKMPNERLEALMKFLNIEVKGAERLSYVQTGLKESPNKQATVRATKKDIPTVASLQVGEQEICLFCLKTNHGSAACFKAKTMTLEDKRTIIKESRACFACLKKGHNARFCRSTVKCTVCGRKHYSVMCPDGASRPETAEQSGVKVTITNTSGSSSGMQVLMKTVKVCVQGKNGRVVHARMLFDEGSQRSYIKTSVAHDLSCPVIAKFVQQNNLFGGHVMKCQDRKLHQVSIQHIDGNYHRTVKLIGEDVICTSCPTIPQGPWITELARHGIHVGDTGGAEAEDIQILIGSDLRETLMTGQRFKLKNGLVAVESVFGWTLSGPLPPINITCATTVINMLTVEEKMLPKLWDLETIGIRDSAEKISEEEYGEQVKMALQSTMTRDEDGRYVIRLPWINEEVQIPSNRDVAIKRLRSVSERLQKQEEFNRYDQVFRDWEKEDLIEVSHGENTNQHFLPHRPVFKHESTTPVRPVFDASCRVGKNPSLNQCLEKGPNMLQLIPAIIQRFREKPIGVISDIRKAFQMIGVAEEDRNYQKFLWWDNEEIKEYRHCRVVFGMNCSPFILAMVLDHHLTNVKTKDKEVADLLRRSLYVDNCVISVETIKEFHEFRERSTQLLAEAKMDLRQWESNAEMDGTSKTTNVLGLKWDKEVDQLFCQPQVSEQGRVVTKRNVLSVIAQIFDPIGFTCPALLQPKMMLQESWTSKMGWDEEWTGDGEKQFKKWYAELHRLQEIRIPRQAFYSGVQVEVQIHTFCDASKRAYAAVVYARSQREGNVRIQLLSAKSRLAPLDKQKKSNVTINRLELMGCVIGSRLAQATKLSLEHLPIQSFYWTDSTTALAWIIREEDWGTFVGNRSKEIGTLTRKQDWRYVPGPMNPADLPSRGCSPSQLLHSDWWEGPNWLKEPESNWPLQDDVVNEEEVSFERKKSSITTIVIPTPQPRFSSYQKNVRVATYVRRFVDNCRAEIQSRIQDLEPKLTELRKGERDLLYETQRRHYLQKPVLRNLDVTLREDGLYRIKTRLLYKNDTDGFREPILLPSDDPLVRQLIEYIHRVHCHAGTQFVLGKLRERYWIPKGRKTVGGIIRRCTVCRRYSSKGTSCETAPLPRGRVNEQYAFQTTGVDLAGPLLLKGGKKAWIVLYTCALYRGVYLDIVDSLSAEEFLDSLEKFTCTIGRPNHIYSDNGTNFVGANNLMKRINWKKVERLLPVKKIQWTFNPPTAAWWGGWWERLIRTIKGLLRRMLGMAKLCRKGLEKCLSAVAYTINHRPLTTLTEEGDDLIALVPAMFMKDLPVAGLPERDLVTSQDLQRSYHKIRELKRALAARFRKEYLGNLIERKAEKRTSTLKVGDVVLVGADNKKRYEWPLGRIVDLIAGQDGKIRVAKVKTTSGVILRPLQRLYPLEVPDPKAYSLSSVPAKVAVSEDPANSSSVPAKVTVSEDPANSSSVPAEATPKRHVPDRSTPISGGVNQEDDLYVTKSGRAIRRPSRYQRWRN